MAAATNNGEEGSGAMALASERPCLVAGRQRRGNDSCNGGAVAAVSAAIVEGGNGAGEVG